MKEARPASTRSLLLTVLILSSFAFQAFAYYHPDEGRWLSRDPIGDHAFLTRHSRGLSRQEKLYLWRHSLDSAYVFVGNSPTYVVDPSGLFRFPITKEEWKCYCDFLNWSEMGKVSLYWAYGRRLAEQVYPSPTPDDEGNYPDGPGIDEAWRKNNAFRHCVSSCALAKQFGPDKAHKITDCHEDKGHSSDGPQDVAKDKFNNQKGREAAQSGKNCIDQCKDWTEDGALK